MLNKKVIIGFIIALLALIVIGFVALNLVPNDNLMDLNLSGDIANVTDNNTLNLSEDQIVAELNATENDTAANDTAANDAVANDTDAAKGNATNSSSDSIDPGDVLHKQTFTITGNETGQNEGMEPGTYVMYYTENDGIIKVEKTEV